MTTFATPQNLVVNNFLGLRTRDVKTAVNDGSISAEIAVNVELEPSDDNSGIDLRTTLGNVVMLHLQQSSEVTDPRIVDIFESEQDGVKYLMIYFIDAVKGGCLACYDPTINFIEIVVENLSERSVCNGITMRSTAYDVFIFTNGEEYYSYARSSETPLIKLNPVYDGKPIKGLPLAEYKSSLVIGGEDGVVLASRQGDVTDWTYDDIDGTKAWYQLFYKKITALVPYIDGMLVFTQNDSVVLSGNMSSASEAQRSSASIGGCFNHKSWVLHDKYVFFYDNNQKNIYYYLQNDIGEKVLGQPVANEIQNLLTDVKDMSFTSFIGDNKSEIWMRIVDSFGEARVIVYNYIYGEYVERKMNPIHGIKTYNFKVITFDDTKIFEERAKTAVNCVFDGQYIPARYKTPYLTFGSYSNLKEMDIKPLITYGKSYNNSFGITFFNNKKNKYKRIDLYQGLDFTWGSETPQNVNTPERELWDFGVFPDENSKDVGTVKAKAPSSFYYLGFEVFTEKMGDDFCIKQVEFKELTFETDTIGAR